MYISKYLGSHIDAVVKTMLADRLVPRGWSNNGASTKGRTVTVDGTFTLASGAMVVVHTANAISAEGATLSVNSTTAKDIYIDGDPLESGRISANDVMLLEYDGSHWNILGIVDGLDGETSHTGTVTGTAAVTSSPYYASRWTGKYPGIDSLYTGLKVQVKVPVAGNETYGTVLNINGLGEHPVCVNKSTAIGTRFEVGAVIELIYDADESASSYINSADASTITGVWKIADYTVDAYTKSQVYTKSETYAKSEVYNKTEVYAKSEVYSKTEVDSMRLSPQGRYAGRTTSYAKNSVVTINAGVYVSNKETSNTPVGVLTDVNGARLVMQTGSDNGYAIVNSGVSDDWDYLMPVNTQV